MDFALSGIEGISFGGLFNNYRKNDAPSLQGLLRDLGFPFSQSQIGKWSLQFYEIKFKHLEACKKQVEVARGHFEVHLQKSYHLFAG